MGCFISQNSEEGIVQEKKLKIVMVGPESAGKTSILYYLKNQVFTPTQPTIGLNVETISYKQKSYLIFDVGGKVRSLWSHYYDNLDALIYVLDCTQINNLKQELEQLNKDLQQQKTIVLILFTKCDLLQDKNIQLYDLNKTLDQDTLIQICSSKTGEGIWEAIQKLNEFFNRT